MGFRVGVVGATGATGQVTLAILRERSFPVDELRLFASRRSVGRKIPWGDGEVEVEALEDGRFDGLDVVLNATSAALAREWVPRMVEAGAFVSDKSSAFRLDPDVPLVVREINGDDAATHKGIVASPNCTTAVAADGDRAAAPGGRRPFGDQLVLPVGVRRRPRRRHRAHRARHAKALDQVERSVGSRAARPPRARSVPSSARIQRVPAVRDLPETAPTSRPKSRRCRPRSGKILGAPDLLLQATAVRVPVVVGHSVSLSVSLEREVTPDEAREISRAFDGVRVLDDPAQWHLPDAAAGDRIDEVLVGRVRTNPILDERPDALRVRRQPAQGRLAERDPDRGARPRRLEEVGQPGGRAGEDRVRGRKSSSRAFDVARREQLVRGHVAGVQRREPADVDVEPSVSTRLDLPLPSAHTEDESPSLARSTSSRTRRCSSASTSRRVAAFGQRRADSRRSAASTATTSSTCVAAPRAWNVNGSAGGPIH